MATNDAMVQGIENIMAWFDDQAENQCFSVWKGQDCFLQNIPTKNGDDPRNTLLSKLQTLESSKFRDVIKIKFHLPTVKGIIDNKTPHVGMFTARVTEWDPSEFRQNYVIPQMSGNSEILSKLNGIESRLNAIDELDNEEEEEPEPDQSEKIAGMIGTITELIQTPLIAGLLGKFFNTNTNVMQNEKKIILAGTDTPNDMDYVLNELKKHDPNLQDDLYRLLRMAENNKGQFNFLISMLRKM